MITWYLPSGTCLSTSLWMVLPSHSSVIWTYSFWSHLNVSWIDSFQQPIASLQPRHHFSEKSQSPSTPSETFFPNLQYWLKPDPISPSQECFNFVYSLLGLIMEKGKSLVQIWAVSLILNFTVSPFLKISPFGRFSHGRLFQIHNPPVRTSPTTKIPVKILIFESATDFLVGLFYNTLFIKQTACTRYTHWIMIAAWFLDPDS